VVSSETLDRLSGFQGWRNRYRPGAI
jgi:hypothetical protein